MNAVVKEIKPESPAARSKIKPGDILRSINRNKITDVLDYEYFSYDKHVLLEFTCTDGKIKFIDIRKPEGADLGIIFESSLMDKERSCVNKCIFCFIDQLPGGMRKTLYYKDDDVRLSFLQGNYITLTNLSKQDIERIIKLRISPINVSVHSLDPELRSFMLGGAKGGEGIKTLKKLAGAGIKLNCQIVCCPGINDGRKLSKTIEDFITLGSGINSVSIVPVGLTKHRKGLLKLRPFNKKLARQTIKQVEHYSAKCLLMRGSRVFYCADELYMLAGYDLPANDFYEDYPQLENGVGMMRLFITEFMIALKKIKSSTNRKKNTESKENQQSRTISCTIITGTLVYPYLTKLLVTAKEKYDTINCNVYAVNNNFFGESITVSGLITGNDIIGQLKGKKLGKRLLIPQNMLKRGEELFLDDMTVTEVSEALEVPVCIIKQDGADFLHAIIDHSDPQK